VCDVEVFGSRIPSGQVGEIVVTATRPQPAVRFPLRTQSRSNDLSLSISHRFALDERSATPRSRKRAHSVSYLYELKDRWDREILVFHWHPMSNSSVKTPHAHVSGARPIPLSARPSGELPPPLDLSNVHIPNGILQIEEVLLMLIRDLGVQPTTDRWEQTLLASLDQSRKSGDIQ
jgi:hypothetical protein